MDRSQAQSPFYIGVDVGGTNVKAGVVDSNGQPRSHVNIPTEASNGPDAGVKTIGTAARKAIEESGLKLADIKGVGLATPGTMDIPAGMLLNPPNLPGWTDFPIRQRVADEVGLQTILQNDANAAAYGEFWAGAARDVRSLVLWTLGTGIGCGIIIDDLIIEGAHSHGAECGHIIIQYEGGRLCGTGQYGTLEAYAGAKAVIKRCEEALATGRKSSLTAKIAAGEELTPLLIAQAAGDGDNLALDIVLETARFMGVGTTTLMHTIDPEMVLIGGAMTFGSTETPLGQRFLQEIRNEVQKRAFPIPATKTKIEFASLGGAAGFIGAAGCAKLKFAK